MRTSCREVDNPKLWARNDGRGKGQVSSLRRLHIWMYHRVLPNPQPKREVLAPSNESSRVAVTARLAVSKPQFYVVRRPHRAVAFSVRLPFDGFRFRALCSTSCAAIPCRSDTTPTLTLICFNHGHSPTC